LFMLFTVKVKFRLSFFNRVVLIAN